MNHQVDKYDIFMKMLDIIEQEQIASVSTLPDEQMQKARIFIERFNLFQQQTVVELTEGDLRMNRDTYNVGQAGAVGPNARAQNITFTQIGNQIEELVDLSELADELSRLRQAMKKEAVEAEHDIAVSEVAKAEQAAKAENTPKVAEHLKAAGKWALDIAVKLSIPVAIEALKKSLGMT